MSASPHHNFPWYYRSYHPSIHTGLSALQLFVHYTYRCPVRTRFALSLSLLIDCLSAFSSSFSAAGLLLTIRYPGPDNQLLLK